MTEEMPEEPQVTVALPPTIDMIVSRYNMPNEVRAALLTDLRAREDAMAEAMQMLAIRYGMYPQIVAYVMGALHFGSPKSPEANAMIQANYKQLMDEIAGQQPDGPTE